MLLTTPNYRTASANRVLVHIQTHETSFGTLSHGGDLPLLAMS